MIVALAGRRIDAPGAPAPRFPLANVETVRRRVRDVLESRGAATLVSSAACGADLLAQSEAGKLGLRRRVILPFDRQRFLKSSVIDRPGGWAPLYNQLLDSVTAAGDLDVLSGTAEDAQEGYVALIRAILDEAETLGRSLREPVIALLVWDGSSLDDQDLTAAFGEEAKRRGIPVVEVSTL
jgi:hypothetical protein